MGGHGRNQEKRGLRTGEKLIELFMEMIENYMYRVLTKY